MPLSVKEIEKARPGPKDRKLTDEKGLFLLITANGSKRWHLKYRFDGKEKRIGFGPFPEVSLKAARAKRDEARALLAEGIDPSQKRKAERLEGRASRESTFGVIARELIEKRATDGDKAICDTTRTKTEWLLSLLEPTLGSVPVTEVTAPMLLAVLQDVEKSGRRETARRLRSFASRVIDYAVVTGRAMHNPAKSLQRALRSPKVRSHPAIINPREIGDLLKAIDGYKGYASTNAALKLSAHLFQRPGEIRAMKWADLDLDEAVWTIPAGETKMRREHQVPLSRQAIAIIRSMADVSAYSEWVFPSWTPKKPLSENAVNGALKRLGYAGKMTAHGFRSTASSLLNESRLWSPDAIERSLAHQDANATRKVYNRTQYWDERVAMMQWWSDTLDSLRAGDFGALKAGGQRPPN
jgi:integrase